jgi:hypothetical protein
VNYGRDVSPAPGPILNTALLIVNNEKKAYEARPGLVMTRKSIIGNYRLVSKETWVFFVNWYRGSGPEIKVFFQEVS